VWARAVLSFIVIALVAIKSVSATSGELRYHFDIISAHDTRDIEVDPGHYSVTILLYAINPVAKAGVMNIGIPIESVKCTPIYYQSNIWFTYLRPRVTEIFLRERLSWKNDIMIPIPCSAVVMWHCGSGHFGYKTREQYYIVGMLNKPCSAENIISCDFPNIPKSEYQTRCDSIVLNSQHGYISINCNPRPLFVQKSFPCEAISVFHCTDRGLHYLRLYVRRGLGFFNGLFESQLLSKQRLPLIVSYKSTSDCSRTKDNGEYRNNNIRPFRAFILMLGGLGLGGLVFGSGVNCIFREIERKRLNDLEQWKRKLLVWGFALAFVGLSIMIFGMIGPMMGLF
jgi:hypothetical protein